MRRVTTGARIVTTAGSEAGLWFVAALTSGDTGLGKAMRFVARDAFGVTEVKRHIAAGIFVAAATSHRFARRLCGQRARSGMDVVTLFTFGDLVIWMHVGVTTLTAVRRRSFGIVRVVAAIAQAVRLRGELPKRNFCCVTRLATRYFGFFEHVGLVATDAFFVFADDDRGLRNMRCFDLGILVTARAARRCDAGFFMRLMTRQASARRYRRRGYSSARAWALQRRHRRRWM